MGRTLSHREAGGSTTAWDGAFETATHVFELGCGTGRFAERLLERHLPATARYKGIDLGPTMVGRL